MKTAIVPTRSPRVPLGRQYYQFVSLVIVLVVMFVSVGTDLVSVEPVYSVPAAQLQSGAPCSGFYHLVQAGETISSIAGRYGSTPHRISVCNGLSFSSVYVGQMLLVPVYRSAPPVRRSGNYGQSSWFGG